MNAEDILANIARVQAQIAAGPSIEETTVLMNAELDMLGLDGRDRLYERLRADQPPGGAPVWAPVFGIPIDPEFAPKTR